MYSQLLIGLIVRLTALVHYADAVNPEEIPQCVEQLVGKLADYPMHPIIQLVLDRAFPDNGTEHNYSKEIDTKELFEPLCAAHHQRLYETLKDLRCHKEFVQSREWSDVYARTILRSADRNTKFWFVGVGVCEHHKRKSAIVHDDRLAH